jgi:phosphopantothenoylcysteine decarboxylase/phosphopantothenate--cysteine ligase
VRFLGNRSSGRQGFAVAAAAARRGAEVTLIAANVSLPTPAGVKRVDVVSAQELHDGVMQYSVGADVVVMAAAVADFRPVVTTDVKIKKSGTPDPIALELTTDVLVELVEHRTGEQVIIGFAAETGDADTSVLEFGKQKLAVKGCDVLVVNDVGPDGAFEAATNEVFILDSEGGQVHVPRADKSLIAEALWDAVAERS